MISMIKEVALKNLAEVPVRSSTWKLKQINEKNINKKQMRMNPIVSNKNLGLKENSEN